MIVLIIIVSLIPTIKEILSAKLSKKEKDVKFIINSDAHRAEDVGNFDISLKKAMEAGLPLERIINLGK